MHTNSGINKVFLLGEIISKPVIRNPKTTDAFLCFNVVTSETIKKGNQQVVHKENHQIKISDKILADTGIDLQPNQIVYIEGKIETLAYIDKEYIKRYDSWINAFKIELVRFAIAV
ncbi:single-stranded DNA-binding protein [Mucilaginibacter litoreus]|uniref:Single-stranded DNA-binding protein n=1 Tax=Mucilaginibacter litoreus TaxID=1048221 RepID=A0ABW3AQ10_9SPHI